ncbi:IS200/IS605 family transposase [Spirulina sp. 06S082]|uniref:IS200/IS605 family transposase n=1 Tax=Spirulina sp. 06S082 TaxID=3110248 RepID=UPI003A4E62D6
MAYWRLYYHLVWATKNRYPYLTPAKEEKLYPYIINKSDSLGCIVHAIGGVEDHIHLIVSIPPKIAIAEFVKKIKGSSSRLLNNIKNDALQFSWQEGYGVFSLGSKQLDRAIAYVQNQKEHHTKNTAIAALEIVQNKESDRK